jgi:hypothetical protein
MRINLAVLIESQFVHTHTLRMGETLPFFDVVVDDEKRPSVYMWLSPVEGTEDFDVLYVGKTGSGASARMRAHQRGFTHSGTGRENGRLITAWLAQGRSIVVHARPSAMQLILGTEISMYSAEEHALCERFAPLWNRAKFPSAGERPGRKATKRTTAPPIEVAAEQPVGRRVEETMPLEAEDVGRIEVDFSDLAGGDLATAFNDWLDDADQRRFVQLIQLLQQRNLPLGSQKITHGYGGQPPGNLVTGYTMVPVLVFGVIVGNTRPQARQRAGWIPLVETEP